MDAGRLAGAGGRALALAAVACLGVLGIGAAGANAYHRPDLEDLPCWGAAIEGVQTRCYLLTVPESRERPNGRDIQIAVTVLLPVDTPADELPAPLVHLAGGPGFGTGISGPMLDFWQNWYADWEGGESRSLILVDQRGTGESEPRLDCDPAIARPAVRHYFGAPMPRDPHDHAEWWRVYLLACRARFEAAGFDVTAYNTAESAADFAALRRALGLEQWDVWGVSYGTQLALELLRVDEPGVRSLILDSVSLYDRPDLAIGNVAASFDRALKVVVRDCLSAEACAAAYLSLQSSFGSGIARLNGTPEALVLRGDPKHDGMTFVVDGRRAAELVFSAMYDPNSIPYVPVMLIAVALRDRGYLRYLAEYTLAAWDTLPESEVVQTSVLCRAALGGEALALLRHDEGRFPNFSSLWTADYIAAVCADWGSRPARPAELGPVYSDVPALILNGRYDPVTPPEWGTIVAGWLQNSTVVLFPHLSHGSVASDPCADAVAARFLDDPGADPRDACLDTLAPPAFAVP